MAATNQIYAFVSYPDAPYTENLIKNALTSISPVMTIHNKAPPAVQDYNMILQWCTYDEMSHELTLKHPRTVLSSCYAIRKSLIRKHFLHHTIQEYTAKNPESSLKICIPATWDLDITHSDELDEMWVDDLYDLAEILPDESSSHSVEEEKWFILKPGMADRGMGIRLFRSKEGLQRIFDSFEESEDEDSESEVYHNDTNVLTSQLRHFVIQVGFTSSLLSPKIVVRNIYPGQYSSIHDNA
jgi:tubulin--tyrosine ligase